MTDPICANLRKFVEYGIFHENQNTGNQTRSNTLIFTGNAQITYGNFFVIFYKTLKISEGGQGGNIGCVKI